MKLYKLEGHKPVPIGDVLEWARWYETAERHVALKAIGNVRISTVFLSIDHSFAFTGVDEEPILFETMIFGGKYDEYTERYHTWEEAEEGHKKAVQMVKDGIL